MTATSAVVDPDISEKNMLKTTTPATARPDVPDQRQRQVWRSAPPRLPTHEFADQEEEGYRQQRLGIDAVETSG